MYYTSKALLPVEIRYSPAEKVALALITAARKLRLYFQAHTIEVYTDCPLKLILQKPELSGRLTKWAVELSEFDIRYTLKAAIKGQAVSDFIAEFTEPNAEVRRIMEDEQASEFQWKLHVDQVIKHTWQRGRNSHNNPGRRRCGVCHEVRFQSNQQSSRV